MTTAILPDIVTDDLEKIWDEPALPCITRGCDSEATWKASGHGCGRSVQWCDVHWDAMLHNSQFAVRFVCDRDPSRGCGYVAKNLADLVGRVWRI